MRRIRRLFEGQGLRVVGFFSTWRLRLSIVLGLESLEYLECFLVGERDRWMNLPRSWGVRSSEYSIEAPSRSYSVGGGGREDAVAAFNSDKYSALYVGRSWFDEEATIDCRSGDPFGLSTI